MTCEFTQPTTGEKGKCWRCGVALPRFARKWCSKDCSQLYWWNHAWGRARWEAIRRRTPNRDLRQPVPCRRCGTPTHTPEVNHINPRNGQGYGNGCHNHQENLEVLCHNCHVETTRLQRLALKQPQLPLLR